MSNISRAKQKFSRLVTQWTRADRECSETYLAWQAACERRKELAIKKNNAWGELEMARAQTSADEAVAAMAACPYWNGEKSLSQPDAVSNGQS